MKKARYPVEFKAEAVKQVTERGHGVMDVAKRLGMSAKSLDGQIWMGAKRHEQPSLCSRPKPNP